jgi:phenylacetate-CoA ligase
MKKLYNIIYNIFGLLASRILFRIAEKVQKRDILTKYTILKRESKLPFGERKQLALKRLIDVLGYSKVNVPYYRDLFSQINFQIEKISQDINYLNDIPYLTKDILREQGRRLISEEYKDKIIVEQKTGSSTGPAAIIYYDRIAADWTSAQNLIVLEWGGKKRYNREVHLSTRFNMPPSPREQKIEARKCFIINKYNIYTDGFGDDAQETLIDDLRKAKARSVQGHSSSLYALARYLKKKGRSGRRLFEIFMSTGEMMTDVQRALIEEVFEVNVCSRYGACEFGVMAQEFIDGPKGQLRVSESMVWPELYPGEEEGVGEFVYTNLRNLAMPLIRYRMGDLGRLEERSDGWWITEIIGRTHDAVEIDGTTYPTHYIQDIFDRCGPIDDFQILVKEGKAKEFRLVVDSNSWEAVSFEVKKYFPTVEIKFIKLEDIVFVGIRGKFTYLLREESLSTNN